MHPALRLVRLGNCAVSFAGTVVGGLAARGVPALGSGSFVLLLGLAAVSTACVTAGGNVLNDLGDREGDRVNHPDRPLVTGAVSVAGARRLTAALFVAAVAAVAPFLFARPLLGALLAVALASLIAYEGRYKARGLAGNALVALLTAAVFLYGGVAAGAPLVVVPFAAMAFWATLSREVIKDMEDAAGDVGRTTLVRRRGAGAATAAARGSVAVALVLSPVPFATFLDPASAAGIMYLALVAAADALFVVSVAWLPGRLHREQGLSKGAMTVALLAFLATAFR